MTDRTQLAAFVELVGTAGEAPADAKNIQERLAGRDVLIVQMQKTIAAALGTSPLNGVCR